MTNERAGPTTAQIIQFPARGRFNTANRNDKAAVATTPVSESVVGGAWYHDEAIRDSKRAGER